MGAGGGEGRGGRAGTELVATGDGDTDCSADDGTGAGAETCIGDAGRGGAGEV